MITKRAKVIAIEGRDRIGKATQTGKLMETFTNNGKRAVLFEFPLRETMTGRAIYRALESGWVKRWPLSFQALHLVNKLLPQIMCLPYLLLTQDYIVLDRWNASSLVYGKVSGVPAWFSRFTSEVLIDPDLILVLDGPGHGIPGTGDAYERDQAFQERIRAGYLAEAAQNPRTHVVIDAMGPPETVHIRVMNALVDRDLVR